ncbi:alanine:cation symporter family protein [Halomonas sp. McH1-25]|uniref:alanine/glycine:cation symporter family protein n=1 Tax=unclassified Halomonas TaxID=2609666 RepID=UPI001EF4FE4D|nr:MULTISPECIES: alanine/glycine:cation symporter family protein [unclassified Halomonas]MCG7601551.1 alanine:cation symporter family protein [Halomonas sp. McH1-25]MCP1343349.1 alanine:cation symporter family protein [Halomonas sp. FL8]MCP1362620.1 alanine:cation symporter family protein [Halomonas sp. BBD45]MCP1365116.1 alanine:cation symporter family protein [Halomonas sp. BBD48]
MLDFLNDLLWGKVLLVLLVAVGVGFSLASRFVQFRYFGRMFRILGASEAFRKDKYGHLSSFQALVLSVAGRVGGGNIAGVAVAITLGGPGAVFWMWVVGLMGMATSFLECTLAQTYKQAVGDGTYRGGPAYYIVKGLGKRWAWLAGLYSLLLLLTFGFSFTALQSYAVSTSFSDAFGVPVLYSGIALAMVVGLIIFGGIKRIARISEVLVPIMAGGYLLIALLVLGLNIEKLPEVFVLIVKSAFGLEPAVAGGIGAAIMMGLKRGLFSNEAGLGSAPNVAAVAYVPHPANQGVVQAFSVFIDTVVICSATAFLILLSGIYDPAAGGSVEGIALTQAALADHVGEWGRAFVSVALLLFAFSTILYNYYLGENSLNFFSRNNQNLFNAFRVAIVLLVCWGATTDLGTVFGFADVTMGLLAVVNLIALILLFKQGLRILKDFDNQIRDGIDHPVFDANQHPDMNLDPASWELEPEDRDRLHRRLGNAPDVPSF